MPQLRNIMIHGEINGPETQNDCIVGIVDGELPDWLSFELSLWWVCLTSEISEVSSCIKYRNK